MFDNIFSTPTPSAPLTNATANTVVFLSVPIQTELVDKALFIIFSIFIAAAVVVGLRIVFAGVLSMFTGLKKLLYFIYLTYTFVWRVAIFVLQLGIFLLVLAIIYYWFFQSSLKGHLETLTNLTPSSSTIISVAQQNIGSLQKFGKTYWEKKQ